MRPWSAPSGTSNCTARAAEAILARFIALAPGPFPSAAATAALTDEALRGCGFLRPAKVAAIRDICARTLDGTVPTAAEAETALFDDSNLIARLVSIRGVGRWTVEMVLISTLGRPDVLPVDDFGVREGWRLITGCRRAAAAAKELAAIGAGVGTLPHYRRLVPVARGG